MTGALHVTVLAVLVGCAAAAVVPESKTPVAAVPAAPIPTGAPAAPAVPAEPAVAKTAPLVEAPTPPAPSVASKKDADVADKKTAAMKAAPEAQLMAASSSSGAIGVAVLPPLLPKCSTDSDCESVVGKHSACGKDFWCECTDGAVFDKAFGKRCLLSRLGVGPGETCKENGDCKLPNSYCKSTGKGDGSCHCQKDFVFSSDGKRCLQAATAEKRVCEEARQCVQLLQSPAAPAGGAACVEGQCRCRYDYEPVNGTCVLKKARGKACSSEAECVDLENGACIQGVCGCKDDFVPAVAANKCLSVLHALEEVCEEDLQCSEGLGDLGRCSAGKCACADGASLSNDKKCVCGQDEEFNKVSTRCEKLTPGKQQAVKEVQQGKGGASSFQSSMTTVVALISSWTLSVLVL